MEIKEEKRASNKLGNSQMKEFEILLRDKMKDGVSPPVIFHRKFRKVCPRRLSQTMPRHTIQCLLSWELLKPTGIGRDMLGSVIYR